MRSNAGAAPLLLILVACGSERGRPGPPAVAIQVRAGSTVYSPDTLPFTVMASDPDGLDSIVVTFLDSTVAIALDFRSEVNESFEWPVPPRIQNGRPLTIFARATDLRGLEGTRTADVTVIPRPAPRLFGR